MMSIRQPITTGGQYLYLEDGIPTRPTGFFNHNALYEVNLPQAGGLEVTKGPGSALYGSDAIAGVINSLTKPSPKQKEVSINPEIGSHGWRRVLLSGGQPITESHGFRTDLNLTKTDGYRDQSEYDRQSATIRADGFLSDSTSYKAVVTHSRINQSGVSSLNAADYAADPRKNLFHGEVGRRKVQASRASMEFVNEPSAADQYSLIVFLRDNQMDLMPGWMLTYDPNQYVTRFQSYGLMAKYRRNMIDGAGTLIAGIDIDQTESQYKEDQLTMIKSGDLYTGATPTGRMNYDFDADQTAISPYLQLDWNVAKDFTLGAGFRFDSFRVNYKDNLDSSVAETVGAKKWFRPDSQTVTFEQVSPKVGLTYQFSDNHGLFISQRYAFRVPSAGQLFRSGSSTNTDRLKPIKSSTSELGLRGRLFSRVDYETTGYLMAINDDVVSYIDGADRKVTNAGATEHKGIEVALNTQVVTGWKLGANWTWTEQSYKEFLAIVSNQQTNYSGKMVARAPRHIGNLTLNYSPTNATRFELEWNKLGGYYTDETNAAYYPGHDLFNLRASHSINSLFSIQARILNIANRVYSESTTSAVGSSTIEYMPGNPRSYYLSLTGSF